MGMGEFIMRREIVRGRSVKIVQAKINYMKEKGWYPVCDIKQDPDYNDPPGYVCVIQNDNVIARPESYWGKAYY